MKENKNNSTDIFKEEWSQLYREYEEYLKRTMDIKNKSFSITDLEKEIRTIKDKSSELISKLTSHMINRIDQTEIIAENKRLSREGDRFNCT